MNVKPKFRSFLAAGIFIVGIGVWNACAFSLLGPFESWMTVNNGFYPSDTDEIGGPKAVGNGYRWNVPVVTYAFAPSFVAYYGTNGVAAVENAINLLNSLPPASQMNPSNYPVNATFNNYEAQSQGLIDLKSETLSLLLEHLGLAAPSTSVFCLREFLITNGVVDGLVVQRNIDPFSGQYSDYIAGTLMTYQLDWSISNGMTNAWVITYPVDPLAPPPSTVANGVPEPGAFFSGLTSDDIGGLRYLYSTNNYNEESVLPGVQGVNGAPFVNVALRQGVDKVTFVLTTIDPLLGSFYQPFTNQFTDTYITNNSVLHQQLERVTTQPDIIFSANILTPGSAWVSRTSTSNWLNESTLSGPLAQPGPGIIPPPVAFTFNKLGPSWVSYPGSPDDSAADATQQWGSFDGTTNAPIVYPNVQPGNQTPVSLTLMVGTTPVEYGWLVTGAAGAMFDFQSSTDMNDWTNLFAFPNDGAATSYLNENPSSARRFYRIISQ